MSRTILVTAAALVLCPILATCGGGGSGGSGTSTPPPPPPLAIASLAATSSLPLAPLSIATTGGNTDPVTVTFKGTTGFSTSTTAFAVASGSVTTTVPVYVDPTTKRTGTGLVTVVLTQDGQASAPANLTIEDLPAISTYGTTPGQITHAYMIHEGLLLGRTLNEMQSLRQSLATDTTNANAVQNVAHAVYTTLIPASNKARSEVDQIIANPSAVFPWGMINGIAVQFDADQLDFMDRLLAVHLLQLYGKSPG